MPDPQSSSQSVEDSGSTGKSGSSRTRGIELAIGLVLLYLIAAVTLIRYPWATAEPWLDPSYTEAYSYFLKTGAQAGVDYAFTYGPLGHFIIPRFDPALYFLDCGVILTMALCGAIPIAIAGARRKSALAMVALAAVFACLVPGTAGPEIGYLIVVVATTLLLFQSPKAGAVAYALAACFFGFLGLTKFTLLVVNTAAILALALHLLLRRRAPTAIVVLISYLLSLGVFWLAAGQQLDHVVAYVRRSMQISQAYNAGMYLPGTGLEVALGVGLWVLLLAHLVVLQRTAFAKGWANVVPLLFVVFVMLITWKMGIVRQQGHINKFYVTVATIPFFLPYPAQRSRTKWFAFRLLPVTVVVFGVSGYFIAKSTRPDDQIIRSGKRLVGTVRQTFNLRDVYHSRTERLHKYQRMFSFPKIQDAVGYDTIDIFSPNQGVVLFNGLNYHPRPVFQGYQACTPELLRRNGAFYDGPEAPKYVMYLPRLTPVDNRYPTTEDAETLKSIFRHYRPKLYERDMILLERWPNPSDITDSLSTTSASASLGDWITIDDAGEDWQLLELHISTTALGRLRTLVFKMPIITMTVRFADGTERPFRINVGSIETGFILNPYFGTISSIDEWPAGADVQRVAAFRVTTESRNEWALQLQYAYTLTTIPPIAQRNRDPVPPRQAPEN